MKYSSKPFLLLVVASMLAVGVWLLLGSRTPSSRADAGAAQRIESFRPALREDEEKYLSLLERNVVSGGPPKDGIPSIDKPKYTPAKEADEWLLPDDVVFGLQQGGFIAAYPQRILVWHEIVNDRVADRPVSVTYCPLTGTAMGFYGELSSGVSTRFGVSGKLLNSNLLMYDRASDSYWPQMLGKAIAGPAKGVALSEFPLTWTTWERWKRKHPDTLVLSRSTGFFRDYGRGGDPYGSYLERSKGYYDSETLLFSPVHQDRRLPPKTIVVGVRDANGNALAVRKDALRERGTIEAKLGGRAVVVRYDAELDSHRVEIKGSGERPLAFDAMWFAWAAFYPGTQLIQ
ncbi:MAG: DUF3179 domain-containing protein [bacterium]